MVYQLLIGSHFCSVAWSCNLCSHRCVWSFAVRIRVICASWVIHSAHGATYAMTIAACKAKKTCQKSINRCTSKTERLFLFYLLMMLRTRRVTVEPSSQQIGVGWHSRPIYFSPSLRKLWVQNREWVRQWVISVFHKDDFAKLAVWPLVSWRFQKLIWFDSTWKFHRYFLRGHDRYKSDSD